MRDRAQLELSPSAYRALKAEERRATLDELLEILRRARDSRAWWYVDALRVATETKARCRTRSSP